MNEVANDEAPPKTILVVEDDFLIAFHLKRKLIKNGLHVLGPSANVDDALELLTKHRPHAAVLDFDLGSEKVTPVALLLKSLSIPFVLATANGRDELAQYEVLADVPNVGKPTDIELLINIINAF